MSVFFSDAARADFSKRVFLALPARMCELLGFQEPPTPLQFAVLGAKSYRFSLWS